LFVAIELGTLSIYALFQVPSLKKSIAFVSFGLFPFIVNILMMVLPIPSVINDFSTTISCLVLYSLVFLEDKERNLENERKLIQYKTDIMMSQIRPHFIYNTLSTISALCTIDPEKAQELTSDFSKYLRNNLSLAQAEQLNDFNMELEHTKKYLDIEKVRFGKRLNVVYDIRETAFQLPSLSLQPIVENAIKHGIMEKEEGGTVTIMSFRYNSYDVIRVIDNGVGFDTKEMQIEEGHYGIPTVKERLQLLLNGRLIIKSEPGKGTTVSIYIPIKEDDQ